MKEKRYKMYEKMIQVKQVQSQAAKQPCLSDLSKDLRHKKGLWGKWNQQDMLLNYNPNLHETLNAYTINEAKQGYNDGFNVIESHYHDDTFLSNVLTAYYFYDLKTLDQSLLQIKGQLYFLRSFYGLFKDVLVEDWAAAERKCYILERSLKYLDHAMTLAYFYLKAYIAYQQLAYDECVACLKLIKPLQHQHPLVHALITQLKIKVKLSFNIDHVISNEDQQVLSVANFNAAYIRYQEFKYLSAINQIDHTNLSTFKWVEHLNLNEFPRPLISLVAHLVVRYHELADLPLDEGMIEQVKQGYKDYHFYRVLLKFSIEQKHDEVLAPLFQEAGKPFMLEKTLFDYRRQDELAMLNVVKTLLLPLAIKCKRLDWISRFEDRVIGDAVNRRRYKAVHDFKQLQFDIMSPVKKL